MKEASNCQMSQSSTYQQPSWLNALNSRDRLERERAFHQLMDAWHKPIYTFIRAMVGNHEDAADATQNTFVQVMKSVHRFKKKAKFSTWLYSIARNKALDELRRQKKRQHIPFNTEFDTAQNQLQSDPYFEGDEIEYRLHAAVAILPTRQKEIFILRYFELIPFAELAAVIGISEGAAKASFFHAKNKVTAHIKINLDQ